MLGKLSLTFLLGLCGAFNIFAANSNNSLVNELDYLKDQASIVDFSQGKQNTMKAGWIEDSISTGQAGIKKQEAPMPLSKNTQVKHFKRIRKRSR